VRRGLRLTTFLTAVVFVAAACSATASPTPAPTTAPATAAPVTAAPTATPDACAPANLALKAAGKLTIGTDNPAFPPWFGGEPPANGVWQVSDPLSGLGYEGAFAYALAAKLGFTKENVVWVAVPFNNVIQPGPKDFDIDINQVSYSAERAANVDLSEGYFDNSQAVVAFAGSPIAGAKSVEDLKGYKLGAAVGTTSLAYIQNAIKPTAEASVYNTNDLAVAGLQARQIDGIVVDLSTAFYMVGAQLDNGAIVGSLPAAGTPEYFSVALNKGSTLTACVNRAIAALKTDGTLEKLRVEWIASQGNAPALAP